MNGTSWWKAHEAEEAVILDETQWVETVDGDPLLGEASAVGLVRLTPGSARPGCPAE